MPFAVFHSNSWRTRQPQERRRTALVRCAALAALSLSAALAQQASQEPSAKPPARSASKAKLTPQQERGLRLLESAQAESAALQPDIRSFVLWQLANAYAAVDPAKRALLLRQAFLVTQSIEPPASDWTDCPATETDPCGIKSWLQQQILTRLLPDSPEQVEQSLSRAEPAVRGTITDQLVGHYVSKKNFDHAEDLLTAVASQKNYPYGATRRLLLALPQDRSADQITIFSQAVGNFEQYGSGGMMGAPDIGSLIVSVSHRLPPDLILDAIDKVLADAKSDKAIPLTMNVGSSQGNLSLHSFYELRLFQLLPVLERLDKSRADELLRDNAQMQADLERFPNGMETINPDTYVDPSSGSATKASPQKPGNSSTENTIASYGASQDPVQAAQMRAQIDLQMEIQRRQNRAQSEAATDPKQALADALALPLLSDAFVGNPSPRASALENLARTVIKTNPTVAKEALDEIVKLESQLPARQGQGLYDVPKLYLDLGEVEGAKTALQASLKVAEKLYTRDTDADDPNQAFKPTWPSTNLWGRCVQIAAQFSPDSAKEVIDAISDPEIRDLQKVAYASSLVGASRGATEVAEHFKDGSSSMTEDSGPQSER